MWEKRPENREKWVNRKQIETQRECLLVKEGGGLTDFRSSPRGPLEISQLGGCVAVPTPSLHPLHTHRSVASLCACPCARTPSLWYTVCVSFVLPSLKPHDTCHLSQMAGCLPKMQTDDNGLYLQPKVTHLLAVNIGISTASPLAVAHIHTAACKEWSFDRQTDGLWLISDAWRWSRLIRCGISDLTCNIASLNSRPAGTY